MGQALGRHPLLVSVPQAAAKAIAIGAEACALVARTAAVLNRERVREITQARWVCDVGRSVRELAFSPVYPLTRGVHETAAWYREAGWI